MKITYFCDRCGAIIGAMRVREAELEQLGLDPLTVETEGDIIKNNEPDGLLIYSLCNDCVETMSLHESDLPFLRPPDYH